MKSVIAIFAAGLLSASVLTHAQQIQAPTGGAVAQMRPLPQGVPAKQAAQPMAPTMVLPKLSANLQGPAAASQATTDIDVFMALFQKMAQEMREQARRERNAAMDTQVQALQAAASKMQHAALAAMQQAIINGQMQMAAGAARIGQGTQGRPKSGFQVEPHGVPPGRSGAGLQLTPQQKQTLGASANAQQAFAANLAAAQTDAKKAEFEAMAIAKTSQIQQMMDVIRDIHDKLHAIHQSQVEANRGIARTF